MSYRTHEPCVFLEWITPDAEDLIVRQARVSNPKGQAEAKNPERLLRYLIKHKHWSPFEMASMSVEINTTRDIAAQILRHRSFSFQEFSQRYSDPTYLGKAELFELRYQDATNRQSSLADTDGTLARSFHPLIQEHFDQGRALYEAMLDAGVAKECARKILPLQTPSRLYMTGTIRSWIHYLQVRTGPETQKEHRLIAQQIASILSVAAPNLYRVIQCTESTSPSSKPSVWSQVCQQGRSITGKLSECWVKLVSLGLP